MTAFAGIVTFDGAAIDTHIEEQIGRAIAAPRQGRIDARRLDGVLFVQLAGVVAGGRQREPALASGKDHILFAADARLDNRAELAAALTISPPELARIPDEDLLRRMFERWGEGGIARCLGAFAFAHWDAQARG